MATAKVILNTTTSTATTSASPATPSSSSVLTSENESPPVTPTPVPFSISDILNSEHLFPDSNDSNLLEIIYTMMMLVVEGRLATPVLNSNQIVYKTKEGPHVAWLIDRLNSNINKHYFPSYNNRNNQNNKHACLSNSVQCQTASKLKIEIEKCVSRALLTIPSAVAQLNSTTNSRQNQSYQYYQTSNLSYRQQKHVIKCSNPLQISTISNNKFTNINNNNTDEDEQDIFDNFNSNNTDLASKLTNEYSSDSYDKYYLKSNLDGPLLSYTNQSNINSFTIEVFLVNNCCFNDITSKTGDCLLDPDCSVDDLYDCELVERWNISMISFNKRPNESTNNINSNSSANTTNNNNNNSNSLANNNNNNNNRAIIALNELIQAIRSYLHFSEISSWINQTRGSTDTILDGKQLKSIVFRVKNTVSNEDENENDQGKMESDGVVEEATSSINLSTSPSDQENKLKNDFDFHTFPSINLLNLNDFISSSSNNSNLLKSSFSASNQSLSLLRVSLHSRKRSTANTPTSPPSTVYKTCSHLNNSSHNIQNKLLLTKQMNSFTSPSASSCSPVFSLFDHWSPSSLLMTPPTSSTTSPFKFNSIKSSASDEQNNIGLITTPTSFPSSSILFAKPVITPSSSPSQSSLLVGGLESQSPKVLVSNINDHLMLDICTYTKNQLNLSDFNNNISKRKLNRRLSSTTGEKNTTDSSESQTSEVNDNEDSNRKDYESIYVQVNDQPDASSRTSSNYSISRPKKLIKYNNSDNNFNGDYRGCFPLSSSPAPIRKSGSSLFDFDNSLKDPKSIKNALKSSLNTDINEISSSNNLNTSNVITTAGTTTVTSNNLCEFSSVNNAVFPAKCSNNSSDALVSLDANNNANDNQKYKTNARMQLSYSKMNLNYSLPIKSNCLLGSFEESLLNGRMNPVGVVDGFYAEIGASGLFFPEHVNLPVNASFYQVCEDVAASPYLGVINLGSLGKRGYKVPNKGTIQVTLFNPNNTVVKMFVVIYDLSDMPPNHRTFLRQRTMYVPLGSSSSSNSSSSASSKNSSNKFTSTKSTSSQDDSDDDKYLKSYLRYLIHLRFATSKSGKLYLHTNIKLIFARNKCEIDPRLARYEYKTFTEAPNNPRYSKK